MKQLATAALVLIASSSFSLAQDDIYKELSVLGDQVIDLSGTSTSDDASVELFYKEGHEIDLGDIAEKVQDGGQLYTAGNSAILLSEGTEPVLLVQNPDGGFDAMYICRILPICSIGPD